MPYFPCHYIYISFIYRTCWVPTISVLNLPIFRFYLNLLLRRRRWTGILRWEVLGYVLPRLPFLWCYGVFRCPVSLRVVTLFRDIIYIKNILYSWHLVICECFWPHVWSKWSWVMHTMNTWFWHKNLVWQFDRVCAFITESVVHRLSVVSHFQYHRFDTWGKPGVHSQGVWLDECQKSFKSTKLSSLQQELGQSEFTVYVFSFSWNDWNYVRLSN
jgi:hypothetical protein